MDTLPSELLIAIVSRCASIDDVISVSSSTKTLRRLCSSDSRVWNRALHQAAVGAGVYVSFEEGREEERVAESRARHLYNLLCTVGNSTVIPARSWLLLLPNLSRNFILYYFDLPPISRISNQQWGELVRQRFPSSMVDSEEQRMGEEGRRPQGRNRALFIKCLEKLEHKEVSGCSQQEHLLRYVVLHRSYGLTINRMSSREYDPFNVFDEWRKQNSLTSHTTIQVPVARHLCPVDLDISILMIVGRADFRKNLVAQELLLKLNKWRPRADSGHAILGPILITASIRPSPDVKIPTKSSDYRVYTSLDLQDLFDICAKADSGLTKDWFSSKCQIKEAGGYR